MLEIEVTGPLTTSTPALYLGPPRRDWGWPTVWKRR